MPEQIWLAAVIGALVAAVPVIGAWLLSYLRTRQELGRQTRVDALSEWQQIVDRLQTRADTQEKQLYKMQESNQECEKRFTDSERRFSGSERKMAEMEGEVKYLQSQLRRLQVITDDTPPGTTSPTMITANSQGLILTVMGGVSPLLHWLPNQLLGRSVEVLIPERLREAHRLGLKKIVESGVLPNPDQPLLTYALAKDGIEVPVSISLCGYIDNKLMYISAEIRRRYAAEESGILKRGGALT